MSCQWPLSLHSYLQFWVQTCWLWWHLQLCMLEHRYKHGNCKHGLLPYAKAQPEVRQCFGCSGLQSLTTEIKHFASILWTRMLCWLHWGQDVWDVSCQASLPVTMSGASLNLHFPFSFHVEKKRIQFSSWKSVKEKWFGILKTFFHCRQFVVENFFSTLC